VETPHASMWGFFGSCGRIRTAGQNTPKQLIEIEQDDTDDDLDFDAVDAELDELNAEFDETEDTEPRHAADVE